jgi:hypothetical protein
MMVAQSQISGVNFFSSFWKHWRKIRSSRTRQQHCISIYIYISLYRIVKFIRHMCIWKAITGGHFECKRRKRSLFFPFCFRNAQIYTFTICGLLMDGGKKWMFIRYAISWYESLILRERSKYRERGCLARFYFLFDHESQTIKTRLKSN